jgi:hypothetical protein
MSIKGKFFKCFCLVNLLFGCGHQPVKKELDSFSVSIVRGYISNENGLWLNGDADSTVLLIHKISGAYNKIDYRRLGNGRYVLKNGSDAINSVKEKITLKSNNCLMYKGRTIYCDSSHLFSYFPGNIDVMKANEILTKASSCDFRKDNIFVVRFSEMSNEILDGPCYVRKYEHASLCIDSILYHLNKNLPDTVRYYFSDKSKVIVSILGEGGLPKLIMYNYSDLSNDVSINNYLVKFEYKYNQQDKVFRRFNDRSKKL